MAAGAEAGAAWEAARRAVGAVGRVGWSAPASLHLTLKFLGALGPVPIERLPAVVRGVAREGSPCVIPLERWGGFPSERNPQVLWAGPSSAWAAGPEGKRLRAWVDRLDAACSVLGVSKENRPFVPHVTLGRVRAGAEAVGRALLEAGEKEIPFPLGRVNFSSVTLYRSDWRPTGAIHTPLWSLPLGGDLS